MNRLKVIEPGGRPAVGMPASGPAFPGITPDEYKELVTRGVWAESGAGNWTRVAPDGSVWAGGTAGRVAKVRGKNARRLGGGRFCLPVEDRRKTMSVQLSPIARANLERQAEAETRASGQRVTVSMLMEQIARDMGRAM